MARPKAQGATRKLVWRMDASAPHGAYRSADEAQPAADDTPAVDLREHGLLASSLELLGGTHVSETPMDTLPGDLIDEFLKR
jgi:hypothetical protein